MVRSNAAKTSTLPTEIPAIAPIGRPLLEEFAGADVVVAVIAVVAPGDGIAEATEPPVGAGVILLVGSV